MFDYTKASEQLLVDLINTDNSLALTTELVQFGEPGVAPGEGSIRNSTINVLAAEGSGYTGQQSLTYDRVEVSGFVGTVELTFEPGDLENVSDLVPAINGILAINLGENDFVDAPLPTLPLIPFAQAEVPIVMAPTSKIYIGTLDVMLARGEIDLSDLITSTELDGFFIDPSQVVDGKPQISTLFTSNVLPGF